MSVDFYVVVPAAKWPTPAAVQRCLVERSYPIKIERFPMLDGESVISDGALVALDGKRPILKATSVRPMQCRRRQRC